MDGKELSAIIEFARDLEDVNKALCKALKMLDSVRSSSYYQELVNTGLFENQKAVLSEWIRANRSNSGVAPIASHEKELAEFCDAIQEFYQ